MKRMSFFTVCAALVASIGFCGAAAPDASAKAARAAKLKELAKTISENYVSFGIWNAGYMRFHAAYDGGDGAGASNRVDAAGLRAMRARYLKAMAEREALEPENVAYLVEFGDALLYYEPTAGIVSDPAAALEKYRKAAAVPRAGGRDLAKALFRVAECQFALGDRAACADTLRTLVAKKINTAQRRKMDWSGRAAQALEVLAGREHLLDYEKLPVFTDAKAFPEPRKASYEDAFTGLDEITIRSSGLADDDARFRLFETKLRRRGISCTYRGALGALLLPAAFTLSVEVGVEVPAFADLKPHQRAEAYEIAVGEKGATIKAVTKQGALWGLVTFIQMLDAEKKAVRRGTVTDWPGTEGRGYRADYWPGCTEFTVFQKMNSVDMRPTTYDQQWSPLLTYLMESVAGEFRDLGLTLYAGTSDLTMYPHLPFCWPESETFRVEVFGRFAKMGAGVYFPFDDGRYSGGTPSGLTTPDHERFKDAKNCDGEYVSRIYRAVKKDYPDFRMVFCPPFYWGPDSGASYPGDREEYLASLKTALDPEIDVYWTGPMVKGITKLPHQTKWFTDLTGHRPTIFQNGTGPHNLMGYLADPVDWAGWHYPAFFEDDIVRFHQNANTPADNVRIATLADCLWNPPGYEKVRSVKRATNQLLGKEMYDILAPGVAALAYFDKYRFGRLTVDILHEDLRDVTAKYAIASNAWAKAVGYNPKACRYGAYGLGLGWAAGVVKAVKNPPDLLSRYRKDVDECRMFAEKEVGVDPAKGDLFFSPVDLVGGQAFRFHKGGNTGCEEERFVKCVRGAFTTFPSFSFKFECDPFPPTGDYTLYLCGLDDETPDSNTFRIEVNGEKVWEGPTGFVNAKRYSVRTFPIPFKAMKRYNDVKIVNTTPGYNTSGMPWFFVNYAVLKKAAK